MLFRAAIREAVERLLPHAKISRAASIAELKRAIDAVPRPDLVLLELKHAGADESSQLAGLLAEHSERLIAAIAVQDHVAGPNDWTGRANALVPKTRKFTSLTPSQLRVLRLVAQGHSNKRIGRDLDITPATVKAHITVILRKLGVKRRTQAALIAQSFFGPGSTSDDSG